MIYILNICYIRDIFLKNRFKDQNKYKNWHI